MRKHTWAEAGCSGISGAGRTVSLSSATRHVSWETASFAMALGDVSTWLAGS